ncbi:MULTISPECIES: hypothetical protein [unclassified Methanoregula]|uniref:hypothetical protein n=1 Tax=unclassified Methanoregula TaxID=2649730 RepID=UPI0009D022D9|nr:MULTISPECIES: hypothetical protein [unclassified Methanoregula]OPX65292.1 MAG: hypothetical protein A4E33_00325 [Methanoregula sp. PtaB.Bin085]OPY32201.1 MAG: hypothetical protein A4E34_02575 [Methanoregula sp. PtaU1.Bin006]
MVTYSSPGSATDIGFALACGDGGRILVTGEVSNKTSQDLLVLQFTEAGDLDTRFGNSGVFTYGGPGMDRGFSVAVQPDGKILVTGATVMNSRDDVLLIRINPDGSMDRTFGNIGAVTYSSTGDAADYGNWVTVGDGGKIVVSGAATVSGAFDVLVLQFNADGTPDTAFGDSGVIHYGDAGGKDDYGYAHVIQGDGKIVIAGYSQNRTSDEVLVVRFNRDGDPDTSFGLEGSVLWNGPGKRTDYGQGIALQPDGRILVTGFTWHGNSEDLLLMRLIP